MANVPATIARIKVLKDKHNALILAHYYEDSEIQDLADHVGDSLQLAQIGQQAENSVVLLAGVVFMAESVKILSPDKMVIVPDLNAGCSLVDHSPIEKYRQWRVQNPEALMVTYVNSSAEVKAISDVIVTSSNAEKVIRAIPHNRKILFGPDRNLGRYLSKKINREMELWPGSCEVHVLFSARKLFEIKSKNPEALVIAHPECSDEVLAYADVIGSTSLLLKTVQERPEKTFIVATEPGILHQMRKSRRDATMIEAPAEGSCACNECPYMKLNTLDKIELALTHLSPEIQVNSKTAELARVSLERMMKISNNQTIDWPSRYAQ